MDKIGDETAVNSREKLTQALFTVMKQYTFKEITVTQITQEAQLSRRTFYRLYTSKEDILNEYLEKVFQSLMTEIEIRSIQHYWDVVQLYFDFWEQRTDMILLFQKHELLFVLMEIMQKHADNICVAVRSEEVIAPYSTLLPYMLAYTVAGTHNMLIAWIVNGKKIPSDVLLKEIKRGLQSPDI